MSKMFKISLPDGSVKEVPEGSTPADVAAGIGPGLAKAALAAKVDGEVRDIMRPFEGDSSLALITSRDEADALELVRHDYAHILAEAVQKLFPGTQITFGPATEDGFYYDFAPPADHGPFTEEDLPAIEEEMRRIIAADKPLVREVWDRERVRQFFLDHGETFKAEWVMELPENEPITMYKTGHGEADWIDLCRGPHLASTGKLDPNAFKLTRVSGAYWRGDPKNPMLSRIYGTAWLNKKQLDAYLVRLEEAAKRDHRKIAQEMDLFHLQAEAHGSIFWHPKGYLIWRELEAYMRRRLDAAGYREIKTPQLIDSKLWVLSGHWGKFRENMFVVPDEVPSTDEDQPVISGDAGLMALKPMNCPAHVQVFKQGITSYRELPLRLAEFGCCHRNEPHGALHGIMRVRQFTQDDAHIFCTHEQLTDETRAFCSLLDAVYRDLGFADYKVKLATRPEQRIGTDEQWDRAEADLEIALKQTGLEYETLPGEGAFYGPKLEFHLQDAIGRTWQCGTLQLDPQMPQRIPRAAPRSRAGRRQARRRSRCGDSARRALQSSSYRAARRRLTPLRKGAGNRRKRRKPGRDVWRRRRRTRGDRTGVMYTASRQSASTWSKSRPTPTRRWPSSSTSAVQIRGAEEGQRAAQEAEDAGDQGDQDASEHRRSRL
jgi:threonyl-tRNA synthetase